ncbi:Leucine-rich melanocyte differentiation-associated protein [Eumeta japonica]|uniref:Leucine-rich melanocyte differentiation-associated protein n=1 Tax=Eumeta variegata TaxID=151549 RepID=A0A4C1SNV9_EUMVA|nr:Leucine-rich melanocyte differentiation-associated protein [Eumeta japonica]
MFEAQHGASIPGQFTEPVHSSIDLKLKNLHITCDPALPEALSSNMATCSYNNLETLRGLEQFTHVEELILDNNRLGDDVAFPFLPRLKTLSLNNNARDDSPNRAASGADSAPSPPATERKLKYTQIVSHFTDHRSGRFACQDSRKFPVAQLPQPAEQQGVSRPTEQRRQRRIGLPEISCRYYVIHKLRCLRFLDSRRVAARERNEALLRGQFMGVRRPSLPARLERPPPPPPAAHRPAARALPVDLAALGKHKGAYGKCQYKYTGKHSEGNRFILNNDL